MYKSAVNLGSGGFGNVGYFADGGDVMALDMNQTAPGAPATYYDYLPEEMQQEAEQEDQKGFGTMIWDKLTGDDPTEGLRESARVGGSRTEALYGSDPTFMQQLIERYNYPSAFDPETGQQYIPTGFEPESVRMARPEGRRDLPTYPELEDARPTCWVRRLWRRSMVRRTRRLRGTSTSSWIVLRLFRWVVRTQETLPWINATMRLVGKYS
jgi:hypothetical protein